MSTYSSDDRGPRPVEAAVAQRQALEALGLRHRSLQVADRVDGLLHRGRRVRVERVLLGLHAAAVADVVPAGEALCDHAPCAAKLRRAHEVVGAGGPQLVRLREPAVEVAYVASLGDGGHLVDHHLRLAAAHGVEHRLLVQAVHHHGFGAETAHLLGGRQRAHGSHHVVPGVRPAAAPAACRWLRSRRLRRPSWCAPSYRSALLNSTARTLPR